MEAKSYNLCRPHRGHCLLKTDAADNQNYDCLPMVQKVIIGAVLHKVSFVGDFCAGINCFFVVCSTGYCDVRTYVIHSNCVTGVRNLTLTA